MVSSLSCSRIVPAQQLGRTLYENRTYGRLRVFDTILLQLSTALRR